VKPHPVVNFGKCTALAAIYAKMKSLMKELAGKGKGIEPDDTNSECTGIETEVAVIGTNEVS